MTERQNAFAVEYAKHGNATKAAISAGYSAKTANEQGCRLLKHELVAAKIARLTDKAEKKSALSVEKVLKATNDLIDFDPAELWGEDGKLLPIKQMPLEARRIIRSIDYEKQTIKFESRIGVVELSARLLGMLKQEQQTQQAVQIIVNPPPERPIIEANPAKLVPEWE